MKLEDVKEQIDNYFDNVTTKQFIADCKECGMELVDINSADLNYYDALVNLKIEISKKSKKYLNLGSFENEIERLNLSFSIELSELAEKLTKIINTI